MSSSDVDRYLLGTHSQERERLRQQHELWLPMARHAWQRAGLQGGWRVLDLGAGPGDCSLELARAVGPSGRVVALERSATYAEQARDAAGREGLPWLEVRRHDLTTDVPLREEGFDLAWCRWVAMFLSDLDPLLQLLARSLRPMGRFVAHEYVHWETFALHPGGSAVASFGEAVMDSFRAAGGQPNVNRRLPTLLAERGFRIDDLRPLPVLGRGGDPWAQWLERFVRIYGRELIRQGRWSEAEAAQADQEMAAARQDPGSYWIGPTVLELQATRNGGDRSLRGEGPVPIALAERQGTAEALAAVIDPPSPPQSRGCVSSVVGRSGRDLPPPMANRRHPQPLRG